MLLKGAQNNAIKTNDVKVRIDKSLEKSKCWLCREKDETVDHILSECSKLVHKIKEQSWPDKEINPLGIVPGTEVLPCWQIYVQTRTFSIKWDTCNSLGFWDTNRSPYQSKT